LRARTCGGHRSRCGLVGEHSDVPRHTRRAASPLATLPSEYSKTDYRSPVKSVEDTLSGILCSGHHDVLTDYATLPSERE